jgi:hypothetical protein
MHFIQEVRPYTTPQSIQIIWNIHNSLEMQKKDHSSMKFEMQILISIIYTIPTNNQPEK